MMETETHLTTTADGRRLAFDVGGAPDGPLILIHGGTPTGRRLMRSAVRDAEARGARVACYDRPGYGGSDPHPGRVMADVAADVATIVDALGAERFVTWGISGGGPPALTCAALLGDRCAAAASLAGVAPWGAAGLDWTGGMGEDNLIEYAAAEAGRAELEALLSAEAAAMVSGGPAAIVEGMATLLSDQDRAAFDDEIGEDLADSLVAALAPGAEGWIEDDLSHVAPWRFDLVDIRIPVLIWHGRHDLFVNPAHGEWLAAKVPGAEARVRTDDGHLTVLTHVGEVHDWLLARL